MKYRTCPDCGASLDFGETCDCKKESDTAATVPPSTGKDADDILTENRATVKDSEILSEWIKATGAQSKDIAAFLKERFPMMTRQLLTQAAHWERYGVILHPDGIEMIADQYGLDLRQKPKHSQKRRAKKVITFRCIQRTYEKIQNAKAAADIETDQDFIATAVDFYLDNVGVKYGTDT